MLSFLTKLLSQVLSKVNIFSQQMAKMMQKSSSSKTDVANMHKIHIRNRLIGEISEVNKTISAVSAPQRDAAIVKQILSSSHHGETAPTWAEQTSRQSPTKKKLLNSIGRRKVRARSLWHGRG